MEYIRDAFLVNLADYENLGIDFQINIFLLVLFCSMCVAFFLIDFQRRYMHLLVRQLLRHDAVDEESAVTLSKIGLADNFFIKLLLKGGGHITKVVHRFGQPTYTYEEYVKLSKEKKLKRERVDFTSARFYIAPGMMDRAKHINETYRTSLVKSLLFIVLFMMIYVGVMLAMPELLTLLNNIVA